MYLLLLPNLQPFLKKSLTYITDNAPASGPGEDLDWRIWFFNRPLWAIAVAHFL